MSSTSSSSSSASLDYSNIAIQNRKFAKTCVEKKRRDRINRCLDELKDLMSQADDKAKYQKMEKAEILEMAVNYMRNLRSQNNSSLPTHGGESSQSQSKNQDQSNIQYYTLAFRQCLTEFQSYLTLFPGLKDDFKSKIMSYMTQRYMESLAQFNQQHNLNKKAFKRTNSNRYTPYQTKSNDLNVITSESLNDDSNFKTSNDSHNESSSSDNLAMSPALSSPSLCSSPTQIDPKQFNFSTLSNSSSSSTSSSSASPINYYSNYEDFMKVWRPW